MKYTQRAIIGVLRTCYPGAAFVEELQLEDQYVAKIRRAANPYAKQYYLRKGMEIADEVPEDFDFRSEKPVRRIDALMVKSRQLTALEVKISRADFFRDTESKRRAWIAHTNRFIYVTPPGLVSVDEVPEGCGLWEVDIQTRSVNIVRRAKINKTPEPLPFTLVQNLLYRLSNHERNRNRT